MRCRGCKNLIEGEVKSLPGVKNVNVDYGKGTAHIEYDSSFDRKGAEDAIKGLGYGVSSGKQLSFLPILAVITLFGVVYSLVSYFGGFGLLAKLNEGNLSLGLILVIGILASFHCVGMCGGFIAAYTLKDSASPDGPAGNAGTRKPHLLYNLGRLISYTAIGGILGSLGSIFNINPAFSGSLLVIAGVFMLLMSLSLLTGFSWLKKIRLNTPEFIGKYIYANRQSSNPKGPLFIGLATGFMPCGPLQAMQLYALATGTFFGGASAMFLYSLGTIPLMFGLGSLLSTISGSRLKQVYKISGAIVLLLGIMTIGRGLSNFNFNPDPASEAGSAGMEEAKEGYQTIIMDVTNTGYKPNVIKIKKDIPVRWIIRDRGITGCTDEIILYLGNRQIKKKLDQAENIIEFTPQGDSEIRFSCWMKMVWGKFIIDDGDTGKTQAQEIEGKNCLHTKDGLVCQ